MAVLIFAALVLAVAGGFIAWLGDRLGTHIGKKRHTLFGLRPRHTAMLLTIVTGSIVAVLTFGLLFTYNSRIHFALLEGQHILEDNRRLNRDNQDLGRRNGTLQRETIRSKDEAATNKKKARQADEQTAKSKRQLDALTPLLQQTQTALQGKQEELARTNGSLTLTQRALGTAQKSLGDANVRIASAKTQIIRTQKTVQRLAEQRGILSARNSKLQARADNLETRVVTSQEADVVYLKGQEIRREVIATHQSLPDIQQDLTSFLLRLDRDARKQHGGRGENGRAVLVSSLLQPTAQGGVIVKEGSEKTKLETLARAIRKQRNAVSRVVVVAQAEHSTFPNEQTPITLASYKDVLVYPRGATVVWGVMDSRKPESVLLNALHDFLTKGVRAAALRDGIIPRYEFQPGGEPLVGEPIDSATWLALVKEIQSVGSYAQVRAEAMRDAYSGDLLRLKLTAAPVLEAPPPADPLPTAAAPQASH